MSEKWHDAATRELPPVPSKRQIWPETIRVEIHAEGIDLSTGKTPRPYVASGPPQVVAAWLRAYANLLDPPPPPTKVTRHGIHPTHAPGEADR